MGPGTKMGMGMGMGKEKIGVHVDAGRGSGVGLRRRGCVREGGTSKKGKGERASLGGWGVRAAEGCGCGEWEGLGDSRGFVAHRYIAGLAEHHPRAKAFGTGRWGRGRQTKMRSRGPGRNKTRAFVRTANRGALSPRSVRVRVQASTGDWERCLTERKGARARAGGRSVDQGSSSRVQQQQQQQQDASSLPGERRTGRDGRERALGGEKPGERTTMGVAGGWTRVWLGSERVVRGRKWNRDGAGTVGEKGEWGVGKRTEWMGIVEKKSAGKRWDGTGCGAA
ncbi:hypothetical protein OF83DRAFT_763865 [Amylostereum chailletii]|nr:hypothetical protein OF83DRAFT_763865 [Amylostereum chailletii]